MTAFGSYCGTAEVDFTKLYDNGLFLITGRTGGGKTTILDAMCVALYGKATGSERAKDWKQLRCNNAPAAVDTEVEYVFSIGATQYKFYRRWHLPNSKKGEPLLKDAESACYSRPEGLDEWELLASGSAKAVGEAAEDIVKLTQTQFVKVIMLPQGEFRELLTSSSDEKEAIFKKLFDTEHWEDLTDRISAEFRAIEAQCASHTRSRALCLASADCKDTDTLQAALAQGKTDLAALETRAKENTRQAQQSAAALQAAEETAKRFEERTRQRAALERLTAETDQYTALEARLLQSRRWRGALASFRLLRESQAAALRCGQTLELSRKALTDASAALEQAQQDATRIPALETRKAESQTASAALTELARNRVSYDTHVRKLAESEAALRDEEASLAVLLTKKTETETAIAKGNDYLKDCYAALAALNQANEQVHQCRQQYELTRDYEEAAAKLTAAETSLQAAADTVLHGEQTLTSRRAIAAAVEQAVTGDRAYSLAVMLEDGKPCPVCGSVHHPSPARPTDTTPTAAELAQARADAETAAKHLETARANLSACETQRNLLRESVGQYREKAGGGFERTAEQCKAAWDEAETRVAALRKTVGNTERAERKLRQLNDNLTAIGHDIENANTHINNATLQIASSRQALDALTEQLKRRGIGSFEALEQQLARVRQELASADGQINRLRESLSAATVRHSGAQATLTAAQQAYDDALADRDAKQTAFREVCAGLGIAEDTDIAAGVLTEAAEAESEEKLTAYRQQLHFVRTRLTELSDALDGREPPDLDALRTAHADVLEEGRAIAREIGHLQTRQQSLADTAAAVAREDAALAALQPEFDTACRMNDLLSGRNEAGVPIHQYVIGLKMDEVIISANLYLNKLSKGQYAMKRKGTKSGRARHQGLDIEIIDSVAGRERAVATLSGGELFLASLSLAFGLSDVVQSFAGGIHLDSLFIDEGFGSLDSETLDTAMDAITQVRENKLLGIISHVSELKERIPCGIEVVKTNDGSALKLRS